MKVDTECVRGAVLFEGTTGAVSFPIYQSATFRHPGLEQSTGFDYSRGTNPTRQVLENTLALLEKGTSALAFSTGMGAISAVIKLFKPGDRIIVSEDLYGGTYRLFDEYYARYGFEFSWIDTSDFSRVEKAMTLNTRALFIETPSNPMMKVTDIRRCAELAHNAGAVLIVDNTFLTPYFQKPLTLGADIVVHSGTKYLTGHNDTLAGFLVHADDSLEEPLRHAQKSEGATLGAFDSWLALRGIKTLALRMKKHQENGLAAAEFLRTHPKVERVFYTGFADHPQYGLSCSQSAGHNGMVSFYLKDKTDVPRLLKNIKLILFAESLGGVESLMTYPLTQTHNAIPQAMRESAGVTERLMRLSAGIEDSADILADLEQALA
ncbi:MAG: PLP-dependent aspartate aminotransferase family protein [Treponemataceae bacterium]|nr:MAG: PLP-dependent aspartate aminotransferase family protein [Treponemataceae bacterium]